MDKDDTEFEETLKDLFSHKIIDGNHPEAKHFLGLDQGGVNSCEIIGIDFIRNDGDSEVWGIEWDHPDYGEGWVEIALTDIPK